MNTINGQLLINGNIGNGSDNVSNEEKIIIVYYNHQAKTRRKRRAKNAASWRVAAIYDAGQLILMVSA